MMDDPAKKLIDELCSLLDESTILSITSDYDLQDPAQFTAARHVLLSISKDVEAEEATGFNPSGLGGRDQPGVSSDSDDGTAGAASSESGKPVSLVSDGRTSTTTTETTSSSSCHGGAVGAGMGRGAIHVDILDGLAEGDKEKRLADMFVSLKPVDIRLVLRKVKGDADAAMDELLNLQWLEQTGQRLKGVDAFCVSDQDEPTAKRKGKGRKRRKNRQVAATVKTPFPSEATSQSTPGAEPVLDEAADRENIMHVSDWFGWSESESASVYHRNQSSLGSTVVEVLENFLSLGVPPSNSHAPDVHEQEKRVPWIPRDYVSIIFDVTTTSQAAVAAIDVLANHLEKPAYLKYDVPYSLAAATEDDFEPSGASLSTLEAAAAASPRKAAAPSTHKVYNLVRESTTTRTAASTQLLSAAKSHSYASASSAYRKGRSDPLFRHAAAFYAERARGESHRHRAAVSAEADEMVDRQSTRDTIDLHGVTVKDGVDIALDRVWRWWDDSQAKRHKGHGDAGGGRVAALKVVTGLGRHSADGKSRLRVNVFKALVADGWRVEVLTGAYLVTGRLQH